jgi:hypothetical protein
MVGVVEYLEVSCSTRVVDSAAELLHLYNLVLFHFRRCLVHYTWNLSSANLKLISSKHKTTVCWCHLIHHLKFLPIELNSLLLLCPCLLTTFISSREFSSNWCWLVVLISFCNSLSYMAQRHVWPESGNLPYLSAICIHCPLLFTPSFLWSLARDGTGELLYFNCQLSRQ